MKSCYFLIPPAKQSVDTKTKKFHRHFPPLSDLICASLLREKGWEVRVFDLYSDKNLSYEQVIEECKKCDLLVLNTNVYADWQCPSLDLENSMELAHKISHPYLILTGNHGTHYPAALLNTMKAKVVLRAEPEEALSQIAESISKNESLENIPNISYVEKDSQKIIHNSKAALKPLDELPSPAYDLVDLKNYYYELLGDRFAILEAARGCPFTCNFCNRSMFDNKYRKKTVEKFINEVETLVRTQNCKSLYIFDLEFTINRPLVMEFCRYLIDKNIQIRWACQTRADSVDQEMLYLMKKAGCKLIHFGVEAGDEKILQNTKKRIKKEEIKKGIEMTEAAGIASAGFFILGHPNETETELQKTLEFSKELKLTYASFHPLLAFPGSPLFEEKYGKGPYWNDPIPQNPSYFSKEQEELILRYVQKAFKEYFLRPKTILKNLFHGNPKLYVRQLQLFLNFLKLKRNSN